jgi:hypothetical protein
VLGWLLGHVDDAFYLRELARHAGAPVGAVQRELEQLTDAGLVVRDVRGKQVYFQVNREAPIFPELHGLFAKTVLAARSTSTAGVSESPKHDDGESPDSRPAPRWSSGARRRRNRDRKR